MRPGAAGQLPPAPPAAHPHVHTPPAGAAAHPESGHPLIACIPARQNSKHMYVTASTLVSWLFQQGTHLPLFGASAASVRLAGR